MHIEFVVAIILSLISLGFSIFSLVGRRSAHAKESKEALGRKYAALAWAYARAQSEKDPHKVRKHALEAFVIADTAADGKRDFNNKQVAFFVDGCK